MNYDFAQHDLDDPVTDELIASVSGIRGLVQNLRTHIGGDTAPALALHDAPRLVRRAAGEQDLLLGRRQAQQAGDRGLQRPRLGHAAASSSRPQPAESLAAGLRATKQSLSSTMTTR